MLPSRLFYENMLDEMGQNRHMDCDIYEKDNQYHIEMDVPGYKKDEISIECHKGTITVKAVHKFDNKEHHDKKYVCRERYYGKLERSFYLGDIDEDSIKAEYNDGILKLSISLNKETNKKLITIE